MHTQNVWSDEWNQWQARSRSLDAMRQACTERSRSITQDVAPHIDDTWKLEQYARRLQPMGFGYRCHRALPPEGHLPGCPSAPRSGGRRPFLPVAIATAGAITIIHGSQDEVVPTTGSREYAARYLEQVQLIEVEAGHDLNGQLGLVWEVMQQLLLVQR